VPAFDLRDGSKLPASYGREAEVTDKDGKKVKTLVFSGTAGTLQPSDLHAILSAYGAKLVDGSKLPRSYGSEVESTDKDGKKVKKLMFGGNVGTLPPQELHAILSAYGL
jgi:hypothetical protein